MIVIIKSVMIVILQKRSDNMVHQEKLSKSVNWDLSALEKALPETATQVPATTLSHLHIPFSFEIPVPCDPAPYQPASTHLFPLTFLACTISFSAGPGGQPHEPVDLTSFGARSCSTVRSRSRCAEVDRLVRCKRTKLKGAAQRRSAWGCF